MITFPIISLVLSVAVQASLGSPPLAVLSVTPPTASSRDCAVLLRNSHSVRAVTWLLERQPDKKVRAGIDC